ncbi:hypothetical protein niasHT_033368 [Heterodera trifolii]|uniref:Uncharacterized protein n=1 Tax=Heterodera trifolii TaxID=157864 RepID=A0ABD2HXP9_9BILA
MPTHMLCRPVFKLCMNKYRQVLLVFYCKIVSPVNVSKAMDLAYGNYGSLFRTGTRKTFFSYQLENYADLYGSSCFHLLDYHPSHDFRAKFKLMPHESPVDQSEADNPQGQVEDQHGQAADGNRFSIGFDMDYNPGRLSITQHGRTHLQICEKRRR